MDRVLQFRLCGFAMGLLWVCLSFSHCGCACCLLTMGLLWVFSPWVCSSFAYHGVAVGLLVVGPGFACCGPWVCHRGFGFAHHGSRFCLSWVWVLLMVVETVGCWFFFFFFFWMLMVDCGFFCGLLVVVVVLVQKEWERKNKQK